MAQMEAWGDMPSLMVTQNGRAYAKFITDRLSLAHLHDTEGSRLGLAGYEVARSEHCVEEGPGLGVLR
jgi:hypothetical protein